MKFLILRKLKMIELSTSELNQSLNISDYPEFEELTESELHQLLSRPRINDVIMWMCIRELLVRHQFNVADWEVLKTNEIKTYENPPDYEDSDYDDFMEDLGEFQGSDRVIPGMDLTEEDIRRIFETLVGDINDEVISQDIWAAYVIFDRIYEDRYRGLPWYTSQHKFQKDLWLKGG